MRDDQGGRDMGQMAEAASAVWDRDRDDRRGGRSRGRVLVIEAVAETGRRFEQALGRVGLAARVCPDARSGLHAFLRELPDLVVVRAPAADPEGRALVREIRVLADVPVIVVRRMQAGRDGEAQAEGIALGSDAMASTDAVAEGQVDGARVLPASADGEQVARLAASILAGDAGDAGDDGDEGSAGDGGGPGIETEPGFGRPRSPRSGPVTAAEVRRRARSELAAELERQLVACRGNLAEMARRMGKDRSTIRYHLRRFGMLADERSSA
ncbi:MAG: hypothetical protein U0900_14540 [Myxococcota bacterium]